MPIIVPTYPSDWLQLVTIRTQLALIASTMATHTGKPTRVHPVWKLGQNLGKAVSLLRADPTDPESPIRCWMIGTASIHTEADHDLIFLGVGQQPCDRAVKFPAWFFCDEAVKDATSSRSGHEEAERETEMLADYLKVNRNTLGFDVKPPALRAVGPLQIENIDSHPFSEGVDVVVGQCVISVLLRRT